MRVHLVFPPYVESALHGPHLACPLLVAVLQRAGLQASYVDLNLRAVQRSATPEFLLRVLAVLEAHGGDDGLAIRALRSLRELGPEQVVATNPDALFAILRTLRRTVAPAPDSLDELLAGGDGSGPFGAWLLEEFVADIVEVGADVVGFSVAFGEQLPDTIQLARLLRRRDPGCKVMLGGSQINLLEPVQVQALADSGVFDAILVGNGEPAIVRTAKAAVQSDGVCRVLRSGSITREALDDLPEPAFTEIDRYYRPLVLPVLVTKGCYWGRCTFCDYVRLSDLGGLRYIARDEKRVLEEIRSLHARYAPDSIFLVSDAVPPAWYRRLARAAVSEGVSLRTSSYMMHSSSLHGDDFALLAQAGAHTIVFGTESTNPRLLALMRKPATTETIVRNLRDARRHGIATSVNAIIDFPTTTWDEAIETLAEFKRLLPYIDSFNPQLFNATAGTDIADNPTLFGLEVADNVYRQSAHGFHGLSITSGDTLTDEQRQTLAAEYRRLSAACAIRQRRRAVPLPRDWARVSGVILDPTAMILSRGKVAVASLGAVRTLAPWEQATLGELLSGESPAWSLPEVHACARRAGGPATSQELRAWLELLHRSGLVVGWQWADTDLHP